MSDKNEPRDLGNGTSVVFVSHNTIDPTNGTDEGYWWVISNTETDGGRPFLRGPRATEAEAEAASREVAWTEEMLATEWPRAEV